MPVLSADTQKRLKQWQQGIGDARQDFDVEEQLTRWRETFEDFDREAFGPPPIWAPSPDRPSTHLGGWMRELNLKTVESFHDWSINHRPEFWNGAVERLGLQWSNPPGQTADQVSDVETVRWFPGATWNVVEHCLSRYADQTMLCLGTAEGETNRYTGGDLRPMVSTTLAQLRQQGLKRGDRIAIVMPMNLQSVVAYLAVVALGGTVVSIPESFAAGEIATRLRIASASAVVTVAQFRRAGKQIELIGRIREAKAVLASELPELQLFVGTSGQDVENSVELGPQEAAWDHLAPTDEMPEYESLPVEHMINLLFSSGTTGEPKAIPWTPLTLLKSAADGMLLHDLRQGDVACWPTSLGWMMGPWLLFASWLNDATVAIFDDAPTIPEFLSFVAAERVSMLGVIPTIVRYWRQKGMLNNFDGTSIRRFSSTGEASQVDDMVCLSASAGGKPIIEYCGGTEIGGGFISATMDQPNFPAAFTTPAFGLDLVILDDESKTAPEGELFLVPPSVGLSQSILNRDHHEAYFQGVPSDEKGRTLRRHGDRFRRYDSGLWVACGRADDTMNLGGIKVSSAELERALNQLPCFAETAAIAIAPAHGGPEELVLFAVAGSKSKPDDAIAQCNQKLKRDVNPLFRVSRLQWVDVLPRTASNKVMRRVLRDQVIQDRNKDD